MAMMPEYWVLTLECGHLIETWQTMKSSESTLHLGASIPCFKCGSEPVERRILAITVKGVDLTPYARPPESPPPEAPPRHKARGWRQARLPIAEELLLYV